MWTELLLAVVCILIIVNEILRFRKIRSEIPPGPFPWPLIGNLRLIRHLSRKLHGQHEAFLELSRQYSSNLVSLRLGKTNIIAVNGYKEIQNILGSEEYDGRPWNEFINIRNMGLKKGVTMTDGPEWKATRGWLTKSLRQIGFGRTPMSEHIKNELQLILDSVKDGGVVSMKSIIAPATTNVIWVMATGQRFAGNDKTTFKDFMNLMERRATAFDMAGGILSVFPWIRHIAPEASGYKVLETLNSQLKSILMEAIEDHKKTYATSENKDDLIDMFLKEMDDIKGSDSIFDVDQLFVILLDILIAGSVTSQTTLDFLFLRMTVHQDIQHRLQEELDSVIGWDRLPDLSDRLRLPYAEAVLTESQRLQTVLPIIGPRRVLSECSMNGYAIPKNSCMLLNLWSIHMNPEYFPNPESFEPERFYKDGTHVPDEKLIFFGRGHRRCPGEADARATVFLFFVGIMQRFQLLPAPGQGPLDVKPNLGITISPKPYKILLVPRKRNCSAS